MLLRPGHPWVNGGLVERVPAHRYNFAASQGVDVLRRPSKLRFRVLNPIAVGRRSALRATLIEFCTVGLLALLFLPLGGKEAMAVLVGGGASALGHVLAARVALNGIVPAGVAFAQVVLGAALKWVLLAAVFLVALRVWHLPPLPLLAGLVIGLLAYLAGFHWQAKQQAARVKRDR